MSSAFRVDALRVGAALLGMLALGGCSLGEAMEKEHARQVRLRKLLETSVLAHSELPNRRVELKLQMRNTGPVATVEAYGIFWFDSPQGGSLFTAYPRFAAPVPPGESRTLTVQAEYQERDRLRGKRHRPIEECTPRWDPREIRLENGTRL